MRITGGIARGIILEAPKSDKTRPTTDYLREALFSSIGQDCSNLSFLDLFAGTGAYGLEALSRGATNVTFIEKNTLTCNILNNNLSRVQKCLLDNNPHKSFHIDIQKKDVFLYIQNKIPPTALFDVIFVDPPYDLWTKMQSTILFQLNNLLNTNNPDATIILEAPGKEVFSESTAFKLVKKLGKGKDQPAAFIFKRIL